MEDTLGVVFGKVYSAPVVLILVLMEDTLGDVRVSLSVDKAMS